MPDIPAGQNPIRIPPRRAALLKHVLGGDPVGKSSIAVGYKNEASGRHALADTRKQLLSTMDHYGLTDKTLVRDYLLPLLNATKTITATFEGSIADKLEVADNNTRLSALDMTWRLRASYPREGSDGTATLNIQINNVASGDE